MKRIEFTIPLNPVTKKNSQQVVRTKDGRTFISQNKRYKNYAASADMILKAARGRNDIREPISEPVNVRAIFYRNTKKIVDLTNLQECLHDVLVDAGILADDSCRIIVSTDGSRVRYDHENPRTEVVISPVLIAEDIKERERMLP